MELPLEDPALVDTAALRPVLKDLGLRAHVCGVFGPGRDLTHPDTAVRANCRAYLAECLRIAADLDAGFVAGPMYSECGKARQLPEDARKREWDPAVSEIRMVCNFAASHGLSIAIEPINRFETDLVNTTADSLQMIREIDHPSAQVIRSLFDVARQYRESFEVYGTKQSIEWPLIEHDPLVILAHQSALKGGKIVRLPEWTHRS